MTFNVWVIDHCQVKVSRCERIDAAGCTISPDGSLIFMKDQGSPPVAIYNPRHWLKCEPAAIQTAKVN